jgi:hypothetical protein
LLEKYGTPNATGAGYLTVIDLPYPMFWIGLLVQKLKNIMS